MSTFSVQRSCCVPTTLARNVVFVLSACHQDNSSGTAEGHARTAATACSTPRGRPSASTRSRDLPSTCPSAERGPSTCSPGPEFGWARRRRCVARTSTSSTPRSASSVRYTPKAGSIRCRHPSRAPASARSSSSSTNDPDRWEQSEQFARDSIASSSCRMRSNLIVGRLRMRQHERRTCKPNHANVTGSGPCVP